MLLRALTVAIAALAVTGVTHAADEAESADIVTTSQNITKTTCGDLAAQSQEERTVALIFYYGYLAGLSGAVTVDESKVEGQLVAVRDFCNSHEDATVIAAFVAALKSATNE
jgi:hypothetical protein